MQHQISYRESAATTSAFLGRDSRGTRGEGASADSGVASRGFSKNPRDLPLNLPLALLLGSALTVDPPTATCILAGRLFDGTGDSTRADRVIVIEGDRIKAVGPVRRSRSRTGPR